VRVLLMRIDGVLPALRGSMEFCVCIGGAMRFYVGGAMRFHNMRE